MLVNVNMSIDVYNYFKDYDFSAVANTLLEMYDFTTLPPTSGERGKEIKINVSNETYISLYNVFGPRSKKVSLGRLFEFAYNMDVLSLERFKIFKVEVVNSPVAPLIDRAYRALLQAQKYDNSEELKQITSIVYDYKKVVKENDKHV